MTASSTHSAQLLEPSDAEIPTVSVVIATHGRHASLTRCLTALTEQTLPKHLFEVVVCDDGSSVPVDPAIASFGERIALKVVRRARGGPAAARNEGAGHARGRILAFTDDDCAPAPDWLERLMERMKRDPGHMIGGSIVNLLPGDPYATATQLIMSCVYEYYSRDSVGHRFFSTSNLAVPAKRFWMLDGFSEQFPRAAGEDYDFCARWQEAGFPSAYAPEVQVGHAHGHSLASFWRQHFGYGRALLRVREGMSRRRGRSGIELEAPGFYRQILTYPVQHMGARGLGYAALVLLSQVATFAGGVREWLVPAGQWTAPAATGEHPSPRASSATS